MNIWILAGGGVAVAAALIYQAREITNLEDRLMQLEVDRSAMQAALTTIDDGLNALRSEHTALKDELNTFGSVTAVSNALMANQGAELVRDLANKLATEPNHVEALRGADGRMPDTDQVVKRLLGGKLPMAVADRIWTEHHLELTQMPQFIATVAAAVFETYGAELKPASGTAPSPDDIASALALNPAFMALVEERHR